MQDLDIRILGFASAASALSESVSSPVRLVRDEELRCSTPRGTGGLLLATSLREGDETSTPRGVDADPFLSIARIGVPSEVTVSICGNVGGLGERTMRSARVLRGFEEVEEGARGFEAGRAAGAVAILLNTASPAPGFATRPGRDPLTGLAVFDLSDASSSDWRLRE